MLSNISDFYYLIIILFFSCFLFFHLYLILQIIRSIIMNSTLKNLSKKTSLLPSFTLNSFSINFLIFILMKKFLQNLIDKFPNRNSIGSSIRYFPNNSKQSIIRQTMEPEKGKPYMIELFDQASKELGKFKFIIAATKVVQLKEKIQEKLLGKGKLVVGQHLAIKDSDDFELGSDDEINDVVSNSKVRAYVMKQANDSSQPPNQAVSNPISPPHQNAQQKVQIQQSQAPQPKNLSAVDSPIINLSTLTLPADLGTEHPQDKVFSVIFPQIRKSPFLLDARQFQFLSFDEFSKNILKKFNMDSSFKALIYSQEGQPLLFNLDMIHIKMPKLDFSRKHYVLFTATKSLSDQYPIQPQQILENQVAIKVSFNNSENYAVKIDLSNSLTVLKYKLFQETGIHPSNQIIKFANTPLLSDAQPLKAYNIIQDSILQLSFKNISNLVPASYADKFYYKDIQHIHPQEVQSLRFLRCHLLACASHLDDIQKKKLLTFIRSYTGNQTLVCSFRQLFSVGFWSQAHRIAMQEGLYVALWHYLSACTPMPTTESKNIFLHIKDLFGYFSEATNSLKLSDEELEKREKSILISKLCALTTKPIKTPALIKLDDNSIVVVDHGQMMEQIDKGYTFPLLKKPLKTSLYDNYSLLQNFDIFRCNQTDLAGITVSLAFWAGQIGKGEDMILPSIGECEKYSYLNNAKYANMKIFQPLEVKNKIQRYLIIRNKEKELRIYIGKNKDINRPHIIYDVIDGKEESVSLDLMVGAGKSENLEEQIDLKDLKPVITREPKEAIVVLFDISGSMGSKFFTEPDLKRIGACKLFFEALAYRTIAYNFQHVVSLIFFDYTIDVQCDFTESIYDFNRLIANANPRGSTMLYDSIVKAVEQLLAFKKRYPECILRIMALTDGEDTSSKNTIFDAAKAVVQNDIIMDSFAVGTSCEGLKEITMATGGKCYLTRNLQETLKLFEQQTVLSVRSRKVEPMVVEKSEEAIRECLQKVKYKGFDMPNNVHEFKMPEIKGPGLSSIDIAKKYESEEGQKKISGNSCLKRIAKEIQNYNSNPHPFVAIYPCENISVWKILLLGPKQTPYENGLFLLYANFPGDYPFRAPQVRFITPIYHCNMNQQGRICHSVFDRNYSPALSFRHIVDCIYGLILTPEPDDPLDNVIASYFLSEYDKYYKNGQQATKKNASRSSVELVQQIFGKIVDDIERQKKVQELDKWIEKAKSFN